MRQQICPKTSYATSGSAASLLYVFCNTKFVNSCTFKLLKDVVTILKCSNQVGNLSTEFDRSEILEFDQILSTSEKINGHVVIFLNVHEDDVSNFNRLKNNFYDLLVCKQSKLVIFVSLESSFSEYKIAKKGALASSIISSLRKSDTADGKYQFISSNNLSFNVDESKTTIEITSLFISQAAFNRKTVSNSTLLNSVGFNKQPAVCSCQQFAFLKSLNGDGWHRVLQRLADKELVGGSNKSQEHKLSSVQWNDIISRTLSQPGANDYTVYNLIRLKTLGTTLDSDLEIKPSSLKDVPVSKAGGGEATESHGGDGRANHMVDMTIENIPPHLCPTDRPGSSNPIRLLLDYGCAEGAITAELGKRLKLTPEQILGADVRVIASPGFTFIPLPTEEEGASAEQKEILPSLKDGSVDLVSAAMVFHHVVNIKNVLLELRRVISPRGALIIREHDCVDASTAAFLDITHGLYSLSWSTPVEWPDFLSEYKAYYRSREEWNSLIEAAGFRRLKETDPLSSSKAGRHYNSALQSKMNPKGRIPNVIRAYYAVYVPDQTFTFPRKIVPPSTISATDNDSRSPSAKKTRVEVLPAQKVASDQIFESKKYPGKFYKINATTGATEWIVK